MKGIKTQVLVNDKHNFQEKQMLAKKIIMGLGLTACVLDATAAMNLECVLNNNCVNVERALTHLNSLQKIAEANNGNRSAGSIGHELSANYIAQELLKAGYDVKLQPFSFMKFS